MLVIGAGVAGMRASLSLADMGLSVYLIEKEEKPGGWSLEAGRMGPEGQTGQMWWQPCCSGFESNERIVLYTQAELIEKTGSIGDFNVKISVKGRRDLSECRGYHCHNRLYALYPCAKGNMAGARRALLTCCSSGRCSQRGNSKYHGKPLHDVVFIYCVGSRQDGEMRSMLRSEPLLLPLLLFGGNLYCGHASRTGDKEKADGKSVSPLS